MNLYDSLKASLFFGFPIGIICTLVMGFPIGFFWGLGSGILFGVSLYFFINNPVVQKQISIDDNLLFPDEKIVFSEPANMVLDVQEMGLDDFAYDDFFWFFGLKGKESMGGKLYLTNYRFIFKSHQFNRMRGVVSIFLPTVQTVCNSSHWVVQKVSVQTLVAKIDFIVSNPEKCTTHFDEQASQLDSEIISMIQKWAILHPEKVSDSFRSWDSLNVINNILLFGSQYRQASELITNPIGAIGGVLFRELLDHTLWKNGTNDLKSELDRRVGNEHGRKESTGCVGQYYSIDPD